MLKPLLRQIFQEWADQREDWQPSVELLEEVWETVLGRELADKTRPLQWGDETTLHIAVPSEQWAEELSRYPRRFVGRLNELLPVRVEGIEFHARPQDFDEKAEQGDADGLESGGETSPTTPEPADAQRLTDDARDALDSLDPDARQAALQILGHVEDDT
jgi:hypothetical protein